MATYGLEFSELYTRTQRNANIKNVSGASTLAKEALNDSLRWLAGQRRWIALRRQGTITPVASTQSYALTSLTGFNYPLRVYYISNGIQQEITIVSEEQWAHEFDNDTDGHVHICAFLEFSGAKKIFLSPLPSAAFVSLYSTIYIEYDKKPTEMSADTDVPEIPETNNQMMLVYKATSELVLRQGDIQGAAVWEAKAQDILKSYSKADIHFRGTRKQTARPMFGILEGAYRNDPKQDYK